VTDDATTRNDLLELLDSLETWSRACQVYSTDDREARLRQARDEVVAFYFAGRVAAAAQPGLGPGVTTADLAADLLDARAELAEIAASFAATVAGECPPDEQHCACVPALRAEIAALRVKLEALRLVDTLARNSTDMTKIREAEKAAYACGAIGEEP